MYISHQFHLTVNMDQFYSQKILKNFIHKISIKRIEKEENRKRRTTFLEKGTSYCANG